MATTVHTKVGPMGVDVPINKFMVYLTSGLTFPVGAGITADWYPRVSVNPVKNLDNVRYGRDTMRGKRPEWFIGLNSNDYVELLNDDRIMLLAFFLAGPSENFDSKSGNFTRKVSLIMQVQLDKLYPGVNDQRLDEYLSMAVFDRWNAWPEKYGFDLLKIDTQIENVYKEFTKHKVWLDDMHPFHSVRFDFDVNYIRLRTNSCTAVTF